MEPHAKQYSDKEIIRRIGLGETPLYEILIRRYNPYLYKTGRSYNYNHQDTEDLMQETYIAAYYNLSKFEGRSSFKTWIIRIMLNHCYRKQQKFSYQKEIVMENNRRDNIATPMFTREEDVSKKILTKELGHMLENALQQIPEDYRIVFTLRELNGLSVIETAEALSITENNVKVRMSRAKALLRCEVEKTYTPEDIFEFNLVYCDRVVKNVMMELQKSNRPKVF
jgi:RNA polymerase sigma factor (sigma-70 family)